MGSSHRGRLGQQAMGLQASESLNLKPQSPAKPPRSPTRAKDGFRARGNLIRDLGCWPLDPEDMHGPVGLHGNVYTDLNHEAKLFFDFCCLLEGGGAGGTASIIV